MKSNVSPIPYGVADFARIRRDASYYVDKTAFIPLPELLPHRNRAFLLENQVHLDAKAISAIHTETTAV